MRSSFLIRASRILTTIPTLAAFVTSTLYPAFACAAQAEGRRTSAVEDAPSNVASERGHGGSRVFE